MRFRVGVNKNTLVSNGYGNRTNQGTPAAPSNLGEYTIDRRPHKKNHKDDRQDNNDHDTFFFDRDYFIPFFFAVLADCLNALLVGAPLEPGSRIFSPLPAFMRSRFSWMFL